MVKMMGYISKYDRTFISFMNKKYKKYNVFFEFIDDYRLWLYEDYCVYDGGAYYKQMEKDLEEYSDFQTGKERDKRGKLDGNWEED